MNPVFVERIQKLNSGDCVNSLRRIKRGFEKESLRIDESGVLAKTPHPLSLGSSLTHPFITTDYSEALLEFITPPLEDLDGPITQLINIHRYAYYALQNELLWTASMPCRLPKENEIPIANYGSSNIGQLKHIYRRGLGYRYGRLMQMIAGIHYNFSLPYDFWQIFHNLYSSKPFDSLFISEQYLALIRNCLRFGWLLPLLFGASPAVCSSFFQGQLPNNLIAWDKDTFIAPYATSFRLSDIGYHNKIRSNPLISYNSLDEFINTMRKAVRTPVPEYTRLGIRNATSYHQLSDCILQIEDEHYSLIRPKRVSNREKRMLTAIVRGGIEYIELRAIDINPFFPIGIDKGSFCFLDAFLLMCLLMESPSLTDAERQWMRYNHTQVVNEGRRPGLTIIDNGGKTCSLREKAIELMDSIGMAAHLLDEAHKTKIFTESVNTMKEKILRMELLPSANVLQEMQQNHLSYFDFAWQLSLQHRDHFKAQPFEQNESAYYKNLAKESIQKQKIMEQAHEIPFDEFLQSYLED